MSKTKVKYTLDSMRKLFLDFFKKNGHSIIPSSSLLPENDPTVLFTTAGMQPLVPYLMGQAHPMGKRLANVQKCVRTGDIDDIGDDTHLTFFEMLGSWSLGDYFKEESIKYSFQFLTSAQKDGGLGLPLDKLAVTVFEGDENAGRDDFSASVWQSLGISKERIFYLGKKDNWWGPAGQTGPCGPCTEIFYITRNFCALEKDIPKSVPPKAETKKPSNKENNSDKSQNSEFTTCNPSCECGKYVEIWNNVFMEYEKTRDSKYIPLKQKNVDTGMGLERVVYTLNGQNSVYDIDVFEGAHNIIFKHTGVRESWLDNKKSDACRIILDHIRTAVFMIGDIKGITPSNTDQGYILRRLIRRAVRFGRNVGLGKEALIEIANSYIDVYKSTYKNLQTNASKIVDVLAGEIEKFNKTLESGLKEFTKVAGFLSKQGVKIISGKLAFKLYDTHGFPLEITKELAGENGFEVDEKGFHEHFSAHQEKSKAGAAQKFAGGLADDTEATTRLHTAAHLVLAALQKLLSADIVQKGSNITSERMRFDFNFPRKVERAELDQIEALVNQVIKQNLPITYKEMSLKEAKAAGATGVFEDRYDAKVKVYFVGETESASGAKNSDLQKHLCSNGYFSKEICGGPHVSNTGELGTFKIQKEESSSAGIRRIRGVLTV
ncbi:MAG: alanine--tRNA ligase-related protein [Firmicutes bacterium]|nr:alanine--tRNA ligase-related protein [Bacillota bacterium]